jgi:hypothetical protein
LLLFPAILQTPNLGLYGLRKRFVSRTAPG